MWAAIKSDLSEFVTSVAEETDQVTKSVINDDGEVVSDTGIVQSAQDEVLRLMEIKETFSTPLDEGKESVQNFLDSFEIEKKTEEISTVLVENPETVQVYFEELVPTEISYELFWQRYFYQCDAERIAKSWKDEMEARSKARAEAIQGGIKQVQNILGGALNAVSQTLEKVDKSSRPVGNKKDRGMNLFGNNGRPPFVMNTAVDDDEEEEELGWDDDDDDEDDGNKIVSSGENALAENLKEQVETAIDERDSLKETVFLQRKELMKLRENTFTPEEAEEIEKMKIALSEKDAELGAIKASMGGDAEKDDQIEKMKENAVQITTLQLDVKKLNSKLSMKDADLMTAKEQAKILEEEVVKTREAASSNAKLLQSSLAKAEAEVERMKSQVQELEETKKQVEEMKLELQEQASAKVHAKEEAQETEETQETEEAQEKEQQNNSMTSSESTGVKVEEAAAPADNKTASADEWGDDW